MLLILLLLGVSLLVDPPRSTLPSSHIDQPALNVEYQRSVSLFRPEANSILFPHFDHYKQGECPGWGSTSQKDFTSGWELVRGNVGHPKVDDLLVVNHDWEGFVQKESLGKSLQLQIVELNMSCIIVNVYGLVGVLVNDSFEHSLVDGQREVDGQCVTSETVTTVRLDIAIINNNSQLEADPSGGPRMRSFISDVLQPNCDNDMELPFKTSEFLTVLSLDYLCNVLTISSNIKVNMRMKAILKT